MNKKHLALAALVSMVSGANAEPGAPGRFGSPVIDN